MRRGDLLVFDEFVIGPVVGAPVYTPEIHHQVLAGSDVLAIFAVVDQASGPSNLFVVLEHSADGRVWKEKNPGVSPPPTAYEINGGANAAFAANAQTVIWGYSKGGSPTLAEARLKIYFNTAVNAHVRIHVTMRDPR